MTQQEEDKHIFLGIKPGNKLENEDPITEKEPIEGFYVSLYDELKEKCDPVCFFKPYDKVKVDIANDIYDGILKNEENIEELKHLRLRAINELGVKFSTAKLYADLVDICNPDNFSRINYDNAKLGLANKLFDQIKKHAPHLLYEEHTLPLTEQKVTDSSNRFGYWIMVSETAEELIPYLPKEKV